MRFHRRKVNLIAIKDIRWELERVECTRLAGEPVLCAMGTVLSAPFMGAPLRVFFVPRDEDVISTPGYIRCTEGHAGVVLPSIVVLSGHPEFLTALEPMLDRIPDERVVLDFSVRGRRRSGGDVVLEVTTVSVHASITSSEYGLMEEELH